MEQGRNEEGCDEVRTSSASTAYGHRALSGALPSVLRRGLVFALVWWILVGGEVDSWWVGVPAIFLAATASAALVAPTTLVWFELVRFVPYFLFRSVLGGVDVAWRALHPRMPINPRVIQYSTQLPPGLPIALMANTVSLLPGTLSVELRPGIIEVHALSGGNDILSELEALEKLVAALFGKHLPVHVRGVD